MSGADGEVTDLQEFVECCDLETPPEAFEAEALLGRALDTYRLLGVIEGAHSATTSDAPLTDSGMDDLETMREPVVARGADLEREIAARFDVASGGDADR